MVIMGVDLVGKLPVKRIVEKGATYVNAAKIGPALGLHNNPAPWSLVISAVFN